jgi:hypothetical protein
MKFMHFKRKPAPCLYGGDAAVFTGAIRRPLGIEMGVSPL